ncbi:type III secretion flagellar biosynthesis M-ring domain protein, partial [Chlamydia psittaci 84-8471/1]
SYGRRSTYCSSSIGDSLLP